jgi:hypothetical protein
METYCVYLACLITMTIEIVYHTRYVYLICLFIVTELYVFIFLSELSLAIQLSVFFLYRMDINIITSNGCLFLLLHCIQVTHLLNNNNTISPILSIYFQTNHKHVI